MPGCEGAVNEFLLSSDIYYVLLKLIRTLQQELTSALSSHSSLIPGNAKDNSFCSFSYLLGLIAVAIFSAFFFPFLFAWI